MTKLERLKAAWNRWQEAAIGHDASMAFSRVEAALRTIEPSRRARPATDVVLRSRSLLGLDLDEMVKRP